MTPLDALRARAGEAAAHAHAPYSRRPAGAAVLLADGSWVSGARVENAAYPLTIPAGTAALAIARAAGRAGDVRALALSRAFEAGEAEALAAGVADALAPHGLSLSRAGPDALAAAGALPHPRERPLDLSTRAPADDADGIAMAAAASDRADVPESAFRVGCVVLTADDRAFAGANVEQADWTRGLCAERVALATALAAGSSRIHRVWIACPSGPGCSPCGACRQVLAELASEAEVVMARASGAVEIARVPDLLPGAFGGGDLEP